MAVSETITCSGCTHVSECQSSPQKGIQTTDQYVLKPIGKSMKQDRAREEHEKGLLHDNSQCTTEERPTKTHACERICTQPRWSVLYCQNRRKKHQQDTFGVFVPDGGRHQGMPIPKLVDGCFSRHCTKCLHGLAVPAISCAFQVFV